jgi:hypothetical protein
MGDDVAELVGASVGVAGRAGDDNVAIGCAVGEKGDAVGEGDMIVAVGEVVGASAGLTAHPLDAIHNPNTNSPKSFCIATAP